MRTYVQVPYYCIVLLKLKMIHLLFHKCRSPRVLSDLSFFQCATLFPKSRRTPVSYRCVSKPDRRSTSRIWRIRPRASSLHRKREKKEFQVHLVCLRVFLRRQCVPREPVRTHLPLPLSFRLLSDALWSSPPPCEADIHPTHNNNRNGAIPPLGAPP